MQDLHRGDHVRIVKQLPSSMSHFQADKEAIVVGSYADQYGARGDEHCESTFTIWIKDHGQVSWYDRQHLELIERGREDLLKEWEAAVEAKRVMMSDLDWIFSHPEEARNAASVEALAACFGLTNLWGSHGEGISYYTNAMHTLALAKPFLDARDKAGWLEFCKTLKVTPADFYVGSPGD
jgi:hypothetical protein